MEGFGSEIDDRTEFQGRCETEGADGEKDVVAAQRGLREESERGDHRTDQGRSRAVAETLEARRELHVAKLLYRQALHRRQRALSDEPGIRDGRADNRWGTYNQITEAGGQVRKGEKGTQVLFFKDKTARAVKDENGKIVKDDNGKTVYDEEKRAFPVCKQYTVFNVEQADGLRLPPREGQGRPEWDAHRDAEKIIEAAGPKVQHVPGDRAYYRVSDDKIVLPEPSQFPTRNGYYQTALHECGHSTGHPERMNRETLKEGIAAGFGSPEYAREELRAEISAMMTGERVGVGHDPQRGAAYVENWVAVLEKDPHEIHRASRDAQRMSNYLIDRAIEREVQSTTKEKTAAELTHEYSHARGPQISHTRKSPAQAQEHRRDVGPSR